MPSTGTWRDCVRKGFRVAICEQVEDPRKAKGLVKREVVRVVSPGTLTDATYLDAREPSFMMSIVKGADRVGAAIIDISTGEFTAAEYRGRTRSRRWLTKFLCFARARSSSRANRSVTESLPEVSRLQLR
jgi:DNA mismatch repair ATPase MutS